LSVHLKPVNKYNFQNIKIYYLIIALSYYDAVGDYIEGIFDKILAFNDIYKYFDITKAEIIINHLLQTKL